MLAGEIMLKNIIWIWFLGILSMSNSIEHRDKKFTILLLIDVLGSMIVLFCNPAHSHEAIEFSIEREYWRPKID